MWPRACDRPSMLEFLWRAGSLGSATLASGVALDSVRSPQGPYTQNPRGRSWGRLFGRQRPCIPTAVSMLLGMLGRQACLSPRVVFVDGPPAVGGLFFPISITCVDAFIARISAASRILYATCLGGMSEDSANAAASDAARHADVTGIATQQDQYNE